MENLKNDLKSLAQRIDAIIFKNKIKNKNQYCIKLYDNLLYFIEVEAKTKDKTPVITMTDENGVVDRVSHIDTKFKKALMERKIYPSWFSLSKKHQKFSLTLETATHTEIEDFIRTWNYIFMCIQNFGDQNEYLGNIIGFPYGAKISEQNNKNNKDHQIDQTITPICLFNANKNDWYGDCEPGPDPENPWIILFHGNDNTSCFLRFPTKDAAKTFFKNCEGEYQADHHYLYYNS